MSKANEVAVGADRARLDLVAAINIALTTVAVPKSLTPTRAEYFKAGARATIRAVREAIQSKTP